MVGHMRRNCSQAIIPSVPYLIGKCFRWILQLSRWIRSSSMSFYQVWTEYYLIIIITIYIYIFCIWCYEVDLVIFHMIFSYGLSAGGQGESWWYKDNVGKSDTGNGWKNASLKLLILLQLEMCIHCSSCSWFLDTSISFINFEIPEFPGDRWFLEKFRMLIVFSNVPCRKCVIYGCITRNLDA